MINKKRFNEMIDYIIEEFSTDIYVIHLDKSFKCKCYSPHNSSHMSANKDCKLCLGTGYKIKIKNARGAIQQTAIPTTSKEQSSFSMATSFYVHEKYGIKRDDIIIAESKVYIANDVKTLRTFSSKEKYLKINGVYKKYDTSSFYKNFLEIIRRDK